MAYFPGYSTALYCPMSESRATVRNFKRKAKPSRVPCDTGQARELLLKVHWHANCLFLHSLSCQIKNSHERPISLSLVSDTVLRTAPLQQAEPPSRKFYDCGDSGYIAPCVGSIFSPLVPAGCPSADVIPVPSGLSRQTASRARFARSLLG